jgi:hypothetical protein
MQLTRSAWAVVGTLFAYLVVSFLHWQSLLDGRATTTMWHGVGILAGVLAFLLAVVLGLRASGLQLGPALPLQLPTLALSALVLLFTFVRFLDIDHGRTGAAWAGLLIGLALFLAAYADAAALMRMFRAMRRGRIPGAPSAFTPPPTRSSSDTMSGIDGDWQCTLDTPLGEQSVLLTLQTEGTVLSGQAQTAFGTQAFDGGTVNGNDLTWHVSVTQPMPVELDFSATVEGDTINGVVKAGPLGEQPFTGTRA